MIAPRTHQVILLIPCSTPDWQLNNKPSLSLKRFNHEKMLLACCLKLIKIWRMKYYNKWKAHKLILKYGQFWAVVGRQASKEISSKATQECERSQKPHQMENFSTIGKSCHSNMTISSTRKNVAQSLYWWSEPLGRWLGVGYGTPTGSGGREWGGEKK